MHTSIQCSFRSSATQICDANNQTTCYWTMRRYSLNLTEKGSKWECKCINPNQQRISSKCQLGKTKGVHQHGGLAGSPIKPCDRELFTFPEDISQQIWSLCNKEQKKTTTRWRINFKPGYWLVAELETAKFVNNDEHMKLKINRPLHFSNRESNYDLQWWSQNSLFTLTRPLHV